MHAIIERFRKNKNIYITREWALIISASRLNPSSQNATSLNDLDFYDLNYTTSEVLQNTTKRIVNNLRETDNSENLVEKVQWLKNKCVYRFRIS